MTFLHKYSSRADKSTSNKVTEDVDQLNPEEDSEHFMAILIECLGLLGKLNESVEVSYSLILCSAMTILFCNALF